MDDGNNHRNLEIGRITAASSGFGLSAQRQETRDLNRTESRSEPLVLIEDSTKSSDLAGKTKVTRDSFFNTEGHIPNETPPRRGFFVPRLFLDSGF
ncbi:MAG: hypothetical protein CMQ19_09860 [Gammaproteobacteria bacterium]|nr:hypothetical protein [Gammaproteobacteria bacterium]